MTEPVTLIVSIDTEEDNWQPTRTGITVENIRELPRLDRFFERLGVRATYFTTYHVTQRSWAADILRGLDATGRSEIGAHLHPWNTPPVELPLTPRNTMLVNLPRSLQVRKIGSLTEALTRAVEKRPYAFRAGRWGFGQSTASALLEWGYRVDSSVTPYKSWVEDAGPTHVGAPLEVYRLDGRGDTRVPVPGGPLIEVPLSWGYARGSWPLQERMHEALDRPGLRGLVLMARYLHLINQAVLSPEIDSVENMLNLSRRLLRQGVRHLHLSWHSPSMRPGLSPFATTSAEVERVFSVTEEFIERLAATVPLRFATVSEAAVLLAPAPLPTAARTSAVAPVAAPVAERRLVVVSYHFPPDPAIGSLRWSGLTKYLAPLGWRSWVVTAAPAVRASVQQLVGVTVESRPRRRTLNDFYLYLRHRGRPPLAAGGGDSGAGAGASGNGRGAAGWLGSLRAEGGVLLALPDEARGWILRAAVATRALIRRLRPSAVVSSGPPHSAHLAAWLATRFTGTPWFVDLRDPWAGPITDAWRGGPFYRSHLARGVIAWLERLVITSAAGIVCNTREFAQALAQRYPRVRIEWVPNAVDRELLPVVTEGPFPGLGIVHTGTIYGGRDLGPLLRGLRAFLDRHPEAAQAGTRLRVAGHIEPPHHQSVKQQITTLGLEACVDLLGMVPREEALRLVGRSRLAVVLAQHQEYQVPAKLYELVAMGIPTVVIASPESAAQSEARRLGAAAVDPEDPAALLRLMEDAWRNDSRAVPAGAAKSDYRALAPLVSRMLSGDAQEVRA
jgi:glycosyltransferase involved in cell wall biosynthesis/peptidoglycan/xylan/chitin deacetylase (PgdA/CDA1 family)